jgi:hypothetical protein
MFFLAMNRNTSSPRPSPPFGMEERVAEGRERRASWFSGSKRRILFERNLTTALIRVSESAASGFALKNHS